MAVDGNQTRFGAFNEMRKMRKSVLGGAVARMSIHSGYQRHRGQGRGLQQILPDLAACTFSQSQAITGVAA